MHAINFLKSGSGDFLLLVAGVLGLLALLVATKDIADYYRIEESRYNTPWYSNNWLEQPYTNLRVALGDSQTYWTHNAINTENWLVKETNLNGKTYWTALERVKK